MNHVLAYPLLQGRDADFVHPLLDEASSWHTSYGETAFMSFSRFIGLVVASLLVAQCLFSNGMQHLNIQRFRHSRLQSLPIVLPRHLFDPMLTSLRSCRSGERSCQVRSRKQINERSDYGVVERTTFLGDNNTDGAIRIVEGIMKLLPERYPTLNAAKKSIRGGIVFVNQVRANTTHEIKVNDVIEIYARTNSRLFAPPLSDLPAAYRCESPNGVKVLYEDNECAVVQKPFGIPTLGKKLNSSWTLKRMLPFCLKTPVDAEGVLHKPWPVHRIDAATGGLVVCAKTQRSMRTLGGAFATRGVQKRYRAVLCGKVAQREGNITTQEQGKTAETSYRVVDYKNNKTLIDFYPKTGRNHQLRRHAEDLNCPILGDTRYGSKAHRDFAKDREINLHLFAAEVNFPKEAVPWIKNGDDGLTVQVNEPEFFHDAMQSS